MVITGHQSSESTYGDFKDISELFQNDLKERARQKQATREGGSIV